MGHLKDGIWVDQETLVENEGGRYVKKPSVFRNWITADGSSGYPAQAGRFWLYSAVGCPWAHRAVLFHTLKKLDGIVTLVPTHQYPGGQGWAMGPEGQAEPHAVPGTDKQVSFLHELYTLSDPGCTARVTVPTLWDSETATVVSNESAEIIRMFNDAFAAIGPPSPDYYPEELREAIEAMNARILDGVNNAVNECGRSTSQEAYEAASDRLFATLGEFDTLLGNQRYLCGDRQTESDWRLYPSLIRFDAIYYIGYKCSQQRLEDFPNLSAYLRDLYQTPGIAAVSDVNAMKQAVFGRGGPIPTNGLVPKGPLIDLGRAHGRERLAA